MTISAKYANTYIPVKYFLASYRALSDGRSGIRKLEELLNTKSALLSEWKVIWIGTCALLRTAVDLFKVDMKACIASSIRDEIAVEWKIIKDRMADHAIFWEFLQKERNNVIHEYEWRAYEAWMKPDGTLHEPLPLLLTNDDGAQPVLMMRGGLYDGRNSLDLLKEGSNWVEARIFGAIRRAGFDPEEPRGLAYFQPRPAPQGGVLDGLAKQYREPN